MLSGADFFVFFHADLMMDVCSSSLVGFITWLVRSGLYPVMEEPSVEKALEAVRAIDRTGS